MTVRSRPLRERTLLQWLSGAGIVSSQSLVHRSREEVDAEGSATENVRTIVQDREEHS